MEEVDLSENRKFKRFDVSGIMSFVGEIDLPGDGPRRVISISKGGCGFLELGDLYDGHENQRVRCRFSWPNATFDPIEVEGSIRYCITKRMLQHAGFYFGVEFSPSEQTKMEPLLNSLKGHAPVQERVGARMPAIEEQGAQEKRVSSREACYDALRNLSSVIESAGAKIVVGDLPEVAANEADLKQVFENLIENAVLYRSMERTPYVEIFGRIVTEGWVFSIRDNGRGFTSMDKANAFLWSKKKPKDDSKSAAGLVTVRKFVQRMGGRVWIESGVGEGSTVYFALPSDHSKRNE